MADYKLSNTAKEDLIRIHQFGVEKFGIVQADKYFDSFFDYADKMSPLGNADAESCADYCITLFSDYTKMVTMQNLFHDGGFSFTGISQDIVDQMNK